MKAQVTELKNFASMPNSTSELKKKKTEILIILSELEKKASQTNDSDQAQRELGAGNPTPSSDSVDYRYDNRLFEPVKNFVTAAREVLKQGKTKQELDNISGIVDAAKEMLDDKSQNNVNKFLNVLSEKTKTNQGLYVAGAALAVSVGLIVVGVLIAASVFSLGTVPLVTALATMGLIGSGMIGANISGCEMQKSYQQSLFGDRGRALADAVANQCSGNQVKQPAAASS